MSIFNFFKKQSNPDNTQSNATTVDVDSPSIAKDLFVDDNTPTVIEEGKPSPLKLFLQPDYEMKGYNEGYLYANGDVLHNNLRGMRSQFRLVLDQELDQKREAVNKLRLHAIDVEGVSERLNRSIQEKIRQMEGLIHELDMQKILSVEDEGMVGPPIHAYRIGFVKGLEKYQQEKLFASSTGLFNH